jgi:peptide/nickel transport system ATP-binding protein
MSDLLQIENLRISFSIAGGRLDAVRGVSFRVPQGGTVALVGESGSGKSVISQAIMGILPNVGEITGGRILLDDPRRPGGPIDIAALPRDGDAMRAIRGGSVSIIFQEPMTSLSPIHTIGDQIAEALHLHRKVGKPEGLELTQDMLRLVGFPDPARALKTFPFELWR